MCTCPGVLTAFWRDLDQDLWFYFNAGVITKTNSAACSTLTLLTAPFPALVRLWFTWEKIQSYNSCSRFHQMWGDAGVFLGVGWWFFYIYKKIFHLILLFVLLLCKLAVTQVWGLRWIYTHTHTPQALNSVGGSGRTGLTSFCMQVKIGQTDAWEWGCPLQKLSHQRKGML